MLLAPRGLTFEESTILVGMRIANIRVVFRVDKESDERRTHLSIAGSVSAECADLLESSCEQALLEGRAVDLVLKDVTTIDEAGYALLHRLALKGVRLSANGLYHSYLVESIRQRIGSDNGGKLKR
jgi:ABC-type transporter Mla MlaB component